MRIELSAKAKVITVPKEMVQLKNEPNAIAEHSIMGQRMDQSLLFYLWFLKLNVEIVGKTPVHPGMRSSAFNPASPFHGQSPGYI